MRAVHALANRAADSNGIKLPPLCSLKVIGVDKIAGMMHLAAESDGELRRVFAGRRPGARHSTRHGEEFLAVRQFGSLQQQPVGRAEGLVDIPARAGAAILGELHATGGKPFGDVAGVVDPQEEKRNAPRIRRVQAGQTVANLFKAGAEPAPQKIKVIPKVCLLYTSPSPRDED